MKYEINEVSYGHDLVLQTYVCMLTGLSIDEVQDVTECFGNRWGGQDFIKAFQRLGFNTSPKFRKFDVNTEYPCIIRCRTMNIKENDWYALIYYDGLIYDAFHGKFGFKSLVRKYKDKYYFRNEKLRITSMLQVWI